MNRDGYDYAKPYVALNIGLTRAHPFGVRQD